MVAIHRSASQVVALETSDLNFGQILHVLHGRQMSTVPPWCLALSRLAPCFSSKRNIRRLQLQSAQKTGCAPWIRKFEAQSLNIISFATSAMNITGTYWDYGQCNLEDLDLLQLPKASLLIELCPAVLLCTKESNLPACAQNNEHHHTTAHQALKVRIRLGSTRLGPE